MSTVTHIFLRSAKRQEVVGVQSAVAIAGQGIEGDHSQGGQRQVTMMSLEAFESAAQSLGQDLSPGVRRANIVITGLDVYATISKTIEIGQVVIDVKDYNPPCGEMDRACRGLKIALDVDHRAGVFGVFKNSGEITVGAEVSIIEPDHA